MRAQVAPGVPFGEVAAATLDLQAPRVHVPTWADPCVGAAHARIAEWYISLYGAEAQQDPREGVLPVSPARCAAWCLGGVSRSSARS